jgi:hypothetical protein
LDFAIDFLEPK